MMQSFMFARLFYRDLKANKKRMALTLLAVLWGTLSIVLLLAFAEGLKREFKINQAGMGQGIIIIWGGQTTKAYEGLGKGRPIRFYPEDLEEFRSRYLKSRK
jgi:putative ABC transport system permease protein